MEPTRILFVCTAMEPYLPASEIATLVRQLSEIQEKGFEIRTFMPRYGCINERRNQLHEVIRLSGMNIIINDADHPLIIKVASLPSTRIQIYFIDNEDYFQRREILHHDDGKLLEDNDERCIFFTRGVLETVKKLRWPPNIVHCHGWFACLLAIFIRKAYKDDPLFANTKIVLSLYDEPFTGVLNPNIKRKLLMDGIKAKDVEVLAEPSYENFMKLAIQYSDGLIIGSKEVNQSLVTYAKSLKKPVLPYQEKEHISVYNTFYNKITN